MGLCGIIILQPSRPADAQRPPNLRGYQLGTSRREARASRLPCRPVDKHIRCDAPNNVHLFFDRDILIGITVDFDRQPVAARSRWFAVSDSLVTLYGDPDSVRVKDDAVGTVLTAYWGPIPSRPWGLTYVAFEVRVGDNVGSLASVSLVAAHAWPH